MFIFACTSWMIPESVETNKKQFSKEKKKYTRLKAQEGNLGKKKKKERKKIKEKMTRVEVIEHCHKVNLLKIKQSEFEMMYGHFFFIQISKISFVTPLSKKKSFLLKLFPNKGYHHTRSQLEMHMKSTQRLNEENSLKVNHNKKIITK